jgi:phosphatidylglycerophosphate synthase
MQKLYWSIIPLIIIFLFFVCTIVLFAIKVLRQGLSSQGKSKKYSDYPLLGRFTTEWYLWVIEPVERFFLIKGISPNLLTLFSFIFHIMSGVALAFGAFGIGGWLLLFGSTFDIFDGRIARKRGAEGPRGAFFDSTLDRYGELIVFSGLIIYYRFTPYIYLVLASLIGAMMVSYSRARGEGLGIQCKIGMMQRPERAVYLGVACALSPILSLYLEPSLKRPIYHLTIFSLFLITLIGNITAIRRICFIFKALEKK